MENKILLECLECKDCFTGTNNADGCKCPRCGGMIIPRGYIEEHRKYIKEAETKIKTAIYNGDIRDVAYKEKLKNGYVYGVDLGREKDITVTINFNYEQFNKELIERINRSVKESIRNSISVV